MITYFYKFKSVLKEPQIEIIPNAGAFPCWENPKSVIQLVGKFLNNLLEKQALKQVGNRVNFKPDFSILENDFPNGYYFLFYNGELLINGQDGADRIPIISDFKKIRFEPDQIIKIGSFEAKGCYAANLVNSAIPDGFDFKNLRQLYGLINEELFWIAFRGLHLLNWVGKNKFCGCCGSPLVGLAEEHALKCAACGQITYPRISPAVIVAVIKDNQILLARSGRFTSAMYSVLAGFVEPGESLEDCVKREIREEVGIEVKDIEYFSSQPWPFPDSLMVGFTARYAAGEIAIDHKEIMDAAWFTADNLPELPGKVSIARKLIDWFVQGN